MLLSIPVDKNEIPRFELNEEEQIYFTSKDEVIKLLNRQIVKLELTIFDKDKIINLLETQLQHTPQTVYKRSR